MHNNIIEAGSRDRPLMLATERYPQWRSRGSYALSWKPCQGDSLNLPDHSLVPAKSKSYYQAFNVKSLFGEIVSPKKSQVKLKCDGEDDCCVFEVDVTGSGCLGVWVDVSMGSEVVSRFWVRLFSRLCSSFSSFSKEIACSLREAICSLREANASNPGILPVNSCTIRATTFLKVVIASVVAILDNSNSSRDSINL
nr:hypothetical protein [Tanacetum cinerariifolium]